LLLSIQYMRALAALMVLIVHTFGWFGAQGVDIFFVISGYIMMYIMYESHRGALEFFLARFFRVAPIYYIVTAVALFIGNSNEPTTEHIIHSLLFLKLKWSSPVLSIGWTLEYEFVFYALCAFSLVFAVSKKTRVFILIFSLILLSIILDAVLFPEKAYGHFLEFIFGIFAYFLTERLKGMVTSRIHLSYLVLISTMSLVALFVVQEYVYVDGKLPFRFVGYGFLAFIFFCSFLLLENILPKIKFLLLLGNSSYALYITHTTTLFAYYNISGLSRYHSYVSDSVSVVLVIAVGILTHLYIEKPIAKRLSAGVTARRILSSYIMTSMPKKWLQLTR